MSNARRALLSGLEIVAGLLAGVYAKDPDWLWLIGGILVALLITTWGGWRRLARAEWPWEDAAEIPRLVAYEYVGNDKGEVLISNDSTSPIYELSLDFSFGPYLVTHDTGVPIPRLGAGEKRSLSIHTSRDNEDRSISFMDELSECMRDWENENGKAREGMTLPFAFTYRDAANRWFRAGCEASRNVLMRGGGVEVKTVKHQRIRRPKR